MEQLARHPDDLSIHGETRDATIFFADLVGFTTISEQIGGRRTVALLNRCMGDMTRVLVREGAYVNKFQIAFRYSSIDSA